MLRVLRVFGEMLAGGKGDCMNSALEEGVACCGGAVRARGAGTPQQCGMELGAISCGKRVVFSCWLCLGDSN